jgi:hypothetical protein
MKTDFWTARNVFILGAMTVLGCSSNNGKGGNGGAGGAIGSGGLGGSGTRPLVPDDAGRDAVSRIDATGSGRDAKPTSSADAARVCPRPIDKIDCSSDAAQSCRRTWAEALARPLECISFAAPDGIGMTESRGTCGAYNFFTFLFVNGETTYYYDMTSGQLTAVYSSVGPRGCYAGPPDGIDTSCSSGFTTIDSCIPDAGSGNGPDAAADGGSCVAASARCSPSGVPCCDGLTCTDTGIVLGEFLCSD